MLKGKQKRQLRALAHHLSPIFQVGKSGVNSDMIQGIRDALEKRELLNESSFQTSWAKDDKVFEEQQKQYEKDKNNVNVKEVKPVGMKKSEMQEKIAKSSLMVNNNNTAVAHDVESTISDINQLNYPHNSIEIKSEKEVLEIIKDLEEKLEEEIEMAET